MKSLWSDKDAREFVARYAEKGVNADLALRTYTTRLLGGDPKLVLHGGGNTSVKTRMKDVLGEDVEVICIKGSGWDMGVIEPAGLPAVRLAPLRKLRALAKTFRRGHGQFPARQFIGCVRAQSVGRDAAARIPAAQIRRSHPFHRGARARPTSPTAKAMAREVYGDARGLCALHHSGLCAGQKCGRSVRQESESARASCCCSTAFSRLADDARAGLRAA